jgi:hypothetical protein
VAALEELRCESKKMRAELDGLSVRLKQLDDPAGRSPAPHLRAVD